MTQRDQKTLLMLVLGVGGVGVAFWLLYTYFLSPLALYNGQITSLEDEVEEREEQQVTGVKRDRLMVQKARARSLPASQVKASGDYDKYLRTLLKVSGLTDVDVTNPPPPTDLKAGAAAAAPNATKKAAHTIPLAVLGTRQGDSGERRQCSGKIAKDAGIAPRQEHGAGTPQYRQGPHQGRSDRVDERGGHDRHRDQTW